MRARFQLFKSSKPLDDPVDKRFRRSGILICGSRATHECSFLTPELEVDPAAEYYHGRLDSAAIDELAAEWDGRRERGEHHPVENPLLIFDPNRRGGLQRNHPFTRALFEQPLEILRVQFEKDHEERKGDRRGVEAKETTERLRRLAREASQFMKDKLEDLDAVSPTDRTNEKSFIEKGVVLVPSFTQIAVGEEKRFYARVNGALGLPLGTRVRVELSKAASEAIALASPPIDLEADPRQEGILRSVFSIRGERQARRVQFACRVDDLDEVYAEVQVLPPGPRDVDIPGGFAFHRGSYTVRQGNRRTLKLRARFNPPPDSIPSVTYRVQDSEAVTVRERTALEPVSGTTYYEALLVVEGRKLNAQTVVIAEAGDDLQAQCTVSVVGKEEEGVELDFRLVPHPLGRYYRAAWDRQKPNLLLITTQDESVSRYLGSADDGYPGQHLPPFRVLLAELVADSVCRRIVEEHMRVLPHEFTGDRMYLFHNRLMKEFAPTAHRVMLADPGRL